MHANDTGSSSYQAAHLTQRIVHLTAHMIKNKHDNASKRGLLAMVARRRKLLDYLKREDETLYKSVIQRLSLRR